MSFVTAALIVGGGTLAASYLSSQSASNAASTAAEASGRASDASIAEQRRQYDLNRTDQAPFLTAGTGAVNRLAAGMAPGGEFSRSFSLEDFLANKDPGQKYRTDMGLEAIESSAVAGGLGRSGKTYLDLMRAGQDYASQEYQNAFNRYQTNRANQLNPLQSLAGQGQTTATALGAAGSNMAGNIGNAYMTSAANTGNAAMSAAGIRNSAYGGAANVLGRMYGRNPYGVGQQLSNQYGYDNVYGAGGGGYDTGILSGVEGNF